MIWFISDTHFLHRNIISYCNRPLDCDNKMMLGMEVVAPDDTIIHLGDFGFYLNREKHNLDPFFEPFKTAKERILVKGNHDKRNKYTTQLGWTKVVKQYALNVDGIQVHMQHNPMSDREIEYAEGPHIIIHGHVHNKKALFTWDGKVLWVNVSVEATDYKPVSLRYILDEYGKLR